MVKYQIFIKLTTYGGYVWYGLDLGEFAPALNYESNNLAKLEDKLANYSQTVKLPCTPTNSRVFEYATAPTARPYSAYISYPCIILAGGVPVLPGEPELVLTGSTKDGFEVQILGTEMRVLSRLRDLKFKDSPGYTAPDLGLGRAPRGFKKGDIESDGLITESNTYMHPFDPSIAPGVRLVSGSNILTDRDLKTLAQWGNMIVGYRNDDLPPWRRAPIAVSLTGILDRIQVHTGVELVYDRGHLEGLDLVLTSSEADGHSLDLVDGIKMMAAGDMVTSGDLKGLIKWVNPLKEWQGYPGLSGYVITGQDTDLAYFPPATGVYRIDAEYMVITTPTSPVSVLEITDTAGGDKREYTLTPGQTNRFEVNLEAFTYYRIRYYAQDRRQDPPRASFTFRGGTIDSGKVEAFGYVPVQPNLGFTDAADLLTEVSKALGLFMLARDGAIHLFDAADLVKRIPRALDWSDKLLSSGLKKRYNIPGYGNINIVPFEDNKALNYSDAIEVSTSVRGFGDTKQLFKVKFEAVPQTLQPGKYRGATGQVDDTPQFVAKVANFEHDTGSASNMKYIGSGKPQLCKRAETHPEIMGELIIGGAPFAKDYARVIPASGKYLAETYYSRLTGGMVDRPIMFEVLLNLNAVDVFKFDPMTPVFIDRLGGYFYVNKIANFEAGEPTRVELIKLNYF